MTAGHHPGLGAAGITRDAHEVPGGQVPNTVVPLFVAHIAPAVSIGGGGVVHVPPVVGPHCPVAVHVLVRAGVAVCPAGQATTSTVLTGTGPVTPAQVTAGGGVIHVPKGTSHVPLFWHV